MWMHLLLSASYKPGEILVGHQIVRLQAGQLVFGRVKFSQQIGVSEHTLRMALKTLEKLHQITIKSESKFSVISITNWDKYQTDSPANHQQSTSNQPATHHNKEVQEIQEEIKRTCPQQADDGHKFRFTEIQDAYNRICSPTLPACRAANDSRRKQVKRMVELEFNGKRPFREHGLAMWESYFADCLKNKHWTGDNDRGWKADFDHVTNPRNAIKLLERVCG